MDKPNESRNHSSADNKKSNQNPHLTDEQLLLALDGELPALETEQVGIHLEACWSCRTRREQIEKAIGDVVEYRDLLIRPHFPMPTAGRFDFSTQLEKLAHSIGRPPLWKQILRALRVFGSFSQIEVPRYVWIALLVAASTALFSLTRLWQVPKVSASELLDNARGSEVRAFQGVARPVVYQKLSIRVGNQTITRTSYRDLVGNRQANRLDRSEDADRKLASEGGKSRQPKNHPNAVEAEDTELQRTFVTAHLSWEDPLSPANYSAWYESLDEKLDEVKTVGNDFITLKTTTSEGPIAEASITVRATDFHPVAEDLHLQDSRHIEVQELAWEVLPMEAINTAIFEPDPAMYAVNRHLESVTPQPPVVTDLDLAEAELRARVAIHADRADLGEQIELDREITSSGQLSVVVQGIVSTPERKNDLLAALQGIPHVELRLQTMEEAQSQKDQGPMDRLQVATPQVAQEDSAQDYSGKSEGIEVTKRQPPAIVVAGRPAYEKQLEERFPIAEDRIAFVNKIVELVQDAMAQAWALRRLTNRYTPDMVAELSSGSQQTLELLLRDHVSVLRQEVDEVQLKVSPLISSTSDAPPTAAVTASDWRGTVMNVFSEMQSVNDNGDALLAAPGETLTDPKTVVSEFQQALYELDIQLTILSQQVGGPFLSEPKNSGR